MWAAAGLALCSDTLHKKQLNHHPFYSCTGSPYIALRSFLLLFLKKHRLSCVDKLLHLSSFRISYALADNIEGERRLSSCIFMASF